MAVLAACGLPGAPGGLPSGWHRGGAGDRHRLAHVPFTHSAPRLDDQGTSDATNFWDRLSRCCRLCGPVPVRAAQSPRTGLIDKPPVQSKMPLAVRLVRSRPSCAAKLCGPISRVKSRYLGDKMVPVPGRHDRQATLPVAEFFRRGRDLNPRPLGYEQRDGTVQPSPAPRGTERPYVDLSALQSCLVGAAAWSVRASRLKFLAVLVGGYARCRRGLLDQVRPPVTASSCDPACVPGPVSYGLGYACAEAADSRGRDQRPPDATRWAGRR
jgi:hypothetical protein